MRYHIISVGSELTLGLSVNTNAPFIAKRLGREGYSCSCQLSVPDDIKLISKAISESLAEADGAIITGGLGPTADDVTREAICDAVDCELEYQPWLGEIIKERYGTRKSPLPEMIYRQAHLPSGAQAIVPTIGSAPGIILEKEGKYIVSMPGVPREMEDMVENNIVPWLSLRYKSEEAYKLRVLRTTAKSEASLQEAIVDIMDSLENVSVGILAYPGEIQLQLLAKGHDGEEASNIVTEAEKQLLDRLGTIVFGFDDETLEEVVGKLFKEHNLTLAIAESCTGGLTSKKITDIPGSSDYFLGGIVSYSNNAKISMLDVSDEVINNYGAVSGETAIAMAKGVKDKFGADIGIGITGIAGPGGGTNDKPVGLVHVAISYKNESYSNKFVFFGSRDIIRLKSSNAALDMMRYHILETLRKKGGSES